MADYYYGTSLSFRQAASIGGQEMSRNRYFDSDGVERAPGLDDLHSELISINSSIYGKFDDTERAIERLEEGLVAIRGDTMSLRGIALVYNGNAIGRLLGLLLLYVFLGLILWRVW
jgi:hypothetical protein